MMKRQGINAIGLNHKSRTRFLFIEGGSNPRKVNINNFISSVTSSTKNNFIINIPLANKRFQRFQGFKKIIELLLNSKLQYNISIRQKYREYLIQIAPEIYSKNNVTISNLADSIILAVVRRISRESHHSALLIDNSARFVLELLKNQFSSKYSSITFVIPNLDRWDRPSLRIINRINRLNNKININWIAFTSYKEQLKARIDTVFAKRIISSRLIFLKHFKDIQPNSKVIDFVSRKNAKSNYLLDLTKENVNINLNEVAEDLAFQNYERVYLALSNTLEGSIDKELQSKVYRLVALADASRGDFKEAYKLLSKAYSLTSSATFKAHLKYLQGLICTKRYYDLNAAKKEYSQGLRCLKLIQPDQTVLLEKAWLLNGQALIHALRAKSLVGNRAEKEIQKSFDLEIKAYKIAKRYKGSNFSYLRHNLLANITFLLEINQQYDQAIRFWQKAFERYLAIESPSFEVAFNTRLGLLQCKAGYMSKSLSTLKRAIKACHRIKDPFYEERIYYVLGYTQYKAGLFNRSLKSFIKGMKITANLREWTNFTDHLNGALWNAALINNRNLFVEFVRLAIGIPEASVADLESYKKLKIESNKLGLVEVLNKSGAKLRIPEPKLSSYIPSVDLEGTPSQDLNRYLVSDKRHNLTKSIFTRN